MPNPLVEALAMIRRGGQAAKPIEVNPLQKLLGEVGQAHAGDLDVVRDIRKLAQHMVTGGEERSDIHDYESLWRRETNDGADIDRLDHTQIGMAAYTQDDVNRIKSLKPGNSFILQVPGGSGVVRLSIARDSKGRASAELIDGFASQDIVKRFNDLLK